MIKVKIHNGEKNTEIAFPCKEKQLTKALYGIGADGKQFAPTMLITDIQPKELSMLENEAVNLDELNYLAKLMYNLSSYERERFFAAVSYESSDEKLDMKQLINLAINRYRYTLIKDVSDPEEVGRIHICTIREDNVEEDDFYDVGWVISEGRKLLNSGKDIITRYGLLFKNEEVPFKQEYNGDNFPPYCTDEPDTHIGLEMRFGEKAELLSLPDDELAIKKAMVRLGVNRLDECEFHTAARSDMPTELAERADKLIANKDIRGLNELLNSEYDSQKKMFRREATRVLRRMRIEFSDEFTYISIKGDKPDAARIYSDGHITCSAEYAASDEYSKVQKIVRLAGELCKAYVDAQPLIVEGIVDKYRCLADFNGTVLTTIYSAQKGFSFVVWLKSYDGSNVFHGYYYHDYAAAKECFAKRSGMIASDRLFSDMDMKKLLHCVEFTLDVDDNLNNSHYEKVKKLKEQIESIIPKPRQDVAPELSM